LLPEFYDFLSKKSAWSVYAFFNSHEGGAIVVVHGRRFFAYCVLAGWVVLTPVTVKSGMDWSEQETLKLVTLQQQHDLGQTAASYLGKKPADRQMTVVEEANAEKSNEDTVLKAFSDLGDKELAASRTAALRRTQFWWEFGVWVLLTVIGSALFAEGKGHSVSRYGQHS
jgi:hypothetical protein